MSFEVKAEGIDVAEAAGRRRQPDRGAPKGRPLHRRGAALHRRARPRGGPDRRATCGRTSWTSSGRATGSGTSPSTRRRSTAPAGALVGRALEAARRLLRPVQKLFWNPNPMIAALSRQSDLNRFHGPPAPQPRPRADAGSTSRCRSCATATCSWRAASTRWPGGRRRSRSMVDGDRDEGGEGRRAREGPPAARRALLRRRDRQRGAGHPAASCAPRASSRTSSRSWSTRGWPTSRGPSGSTARCRPPRPSASSTSRSAAPPGRLIHHAPDRLVVVYHNITPARFFLGFHPHLAGLCHHGRRELAAFAPRTELALGRQRVQPAGARGGRVRADRGPAHRARPLALRRGRPRRSCAGSTTTAAPTSSSWGASSRTRRSTTSSGASPSSRGGSSRGAASCWWETTGASSATSTVCRSWCASCGWTRSSSPVRSTTTSSTPTTAWPTSSCASPSTRASASPCRRRCTSACR